MMKWLIILMPFLFSGCAVFEKIADQAETIESAGELAGQIGAGLVLTAPQLGLIVLTVGGLVVAVSKVLKLF